VRRAFEWFFHAEGSSRSAALVRIGLALVAWSRLAGGMMPIQNASPERLLLGAWFYLSSLALFVGFRSQLAAFLLGAQILTLRVHYGFAEKMEAYTHHHIHALGLATLLLAFAPCGKSYSLDRWLALRRGERVPERGNMLGLHLIVVLLSSIYLWGTYSKATVAFVHGDRMAQILQTVLLGSDPLSPLGVWLMRSISWGTLLLEPFLAIALWVPRLRLTAVLLGIAFHLGIYYLLPVTIFTATTILLYLAAFDPDEVHAFLDRMQE
jgi:hypothetical protein